MSKNNLRLPPKFAGVLGDCQKLKVRLTTRGAMPLWDMRLVSSSNGMYLSRGWSQFARTYNLGEGNLLIFRYDGAAVLTITVFDPSTCRKVYPHVAGAGSLGRNTSHINEQAHFTMTLKKGNLKAKQNQYLNMPVEFQEAHGYRSRRKVVLRMGRRSWIMSLKCNRWWVEDHTAFKFGWHQFCIDNGLEVGDTSFFRVVRKRKDCKEEDDEEKEEDDEHMLKVEVHQKDGAFIV